MVRIIEAKKFFTFRRHLLSPFVDIYFLLLDFGFIFGFFFKWWLKWTYGNFNTGRLYGFFLYTFWPKCAMCTWKTIHIFGVTHASVHFARRFNTYVCETKLLARARAYNATSILQSKLFIVLHFIIIQEYTLSWIEFLTIPFECIRLVHVECSEIENQTDRYVAARIFKYKI